VPVEDLVKDVPVEDLVKDVPIESMKRQRKMLTIARKFSSRKKMYHRLSIMHIDSNVAKNICNFMDVDGYIYLHQKKSIFHLKMKDTTEICLFDVNKLLKK
jgi:hypothetical protein